MSKSKGNIISPEEIVGKYGADTARLFILFAAPPERDLEWNDQAVEGCYRFLNRVWRIVESFVTSQGTLANDGQFGQMSKEDKEMRRLVHTTIKRVTEDAGNRFNFNTAISAIMELVNGMYHYKDNGKNKAVIAEAVESLILLLAPFTPHVTEELWQAIGKNDSVHKQSWPAVDAKALVVDEVTVVIQINGKVRDKLVIAVDMDKMEVEKLALSQPKIVEQLAGETPKKVVVIPNKLVNIVQ